jgi:hypothetical protein
MSQLTISSGLTAFAPSSVGGTSTSEQIFPGLGQNFTASTTNLSTSIPAQITVPNNGQYEQQRLVVTASGKLYVHGSSPTVLWKMYNAQTLTVASAGTALLTMSAKSGLTTANWYPWTWQSVFQGDSSSGILQAVSSSIWVGNVTAGTITLTGIASGLNFGTPGGSGVIASGYSASYALNLICSMTFGVSDSKNICYMSQFILES